MSLGSQSQNRSQKFRRSRPHDVIYAEGMQIANEGVSRFPHPAWQDHMKRQPVPISESEEDANADTRLKEMFDAAVSPDQRRTAWQEPFKITAGAQAALRDAMILSKRAKERDADAEIRRKKDAPSGLAALRPLSPLLTLRELEQFSKRGSRERKHLPTSYADLVNPESRLCCLRRVKNPAIRDQPIDPEEALASRFDLSSVEGDAFRVAKRDWVEALKVAYQLHRVPLEERLVWDEWDDQVRSQIQALPRPCTPPLLPSDSHEVPGPASYADLTDVLDMLALEPDEGNDSDADDLKVVLSTAGHLIRSLGDPGSANILDVVDGTPFESVDATRPTASSRRKTSTERYHEIQKQLRTDSKTWSHKEHHVFIQPHDVRKHERFAQSLHLEMQDIDEENEVSNSEELLVQPNSSSGNDSPLSAEEALRSGNQMHDPLYRNRKAPGSRPACRSPAWANNRYAQMITPYSPRMDHLSIDGPQAVDNKDSSTVPARHPRRELEISAPLRKVIIRKTRDPSAAKAGRADVQVTDPRLLVLSASQRMVSPIAQAPRQKTPQLPTWLEDPVLINPPWYQRVVQEVTTLSRPTKTILMQVGLLANPSLLRALDTAGLKVCQRESLQGADLALSPTVGVIFCKMARLQYDMATIQKTVEEATGYYTRVLLIVETVAFGELERDSEILRYTNTPLTPSVISMLSTLSDMIAQTGEDGAAGSAELIFACRGAIEVAKVIYSLSTDEGAIQMAAQLSSEHEVSSDEQVLTDIYGLNTFASLCLLHKAGSLSAYAALDEETRIAEFGGILGIEVAERLSAIVAGDTRHTQDSRGPKRRKRNNIRRQ